MGRSSYAPRFRALVQTYSVVLGVIAIGHRSMNHPMNMLVRGDRAHS